MMPLSLCEILNQYEDVWFKHYQNPFQESSEVLTQFRGLLLEKDDPFSRTCRPGHFTGSCFVLAPSLREVLLLKHRKLGKWLQMGGHCDGEINLAQVALREAQEESGSSQIQILQDRVIDLDIHWIPENSKEDGHYHFDVRYVGICQEPNNLKMAEEECSDLKWLKWDEAFQVAQEESMHRVFKKVQFLVQKGVLF